MILIRPVTLCLWTSLLLYPAASQAVLIPWTDNTPSSLAPFQGNAEAVAQLAGNDLLIYGHRPQSLVLTTRQGPRYYPTSRFNSGALVVPAPPEQVARLLSDYPRYVGLFPTLTSAKVLEQQNSVSRVRYHIHVPVPIPLLSFSEDVDMQHQLSGNSLSTLILDSPIQYGQGRFEWFALKNGQTLVTLTQWGDLDRPRGFLVSTLLKAVPEVKSSILQSVNAFVLESLRLRLRPAPLGPVQPLPQVIPRRTLSEAQLATVQKLLEQSGTPVMLAHNPVLMQTRKKPEPMHFVTSFGLVNGPVDQVQPLLADPANFKKMFRQVRRVTTTPVPGSAASDTQVDVGLGLGILSIPFRLVLRTTPEGEHQNRYQAIGGDIEHMVGRMVFEPVGPQRTRVTLVSAGKLGDDAPFLLRIGKSLPYNDFMPTVGSSPLILDKVNQHLQGKR